MWGARERRAHLGERSKPLAFAARPSAAWFVSLHGAVHEVQCTLTRFETRIFLRSQFLLPLKIVFNI